MRSRHRTAAIVAVITILLSGGAFAINMGFKLHYDLLATGSPIPAPDDGTSMSGQSSLCLSYIADPSLVNASDLRASINAVAGSSATIRIMRFIASTDSLQSYAGGLADLINDFPLSPGEGYRVQVNADVGYKILGSHDPALGIDLYTVGASSASGTNEYCPPYHSSAQYASDLRHEIDTFAGAGTVSNIQRFLRSGNSLQAYTGCCPLYDFPLIPGESYRIQVTADVLNWIPETY